MAFDLTRGEIILTTVIFVFIYSAGFLSKLVLRLSKGKGDSGQG